MKILLIGYNRLSKAIVSSFKHDHELELITLDDLGELKHHNDSDGCIITIEVELPKLIEIIDKLPIYMPIMIKNALPITVIDKIQEMYNDYSIVISPDFSKDETIEHDFLNQQYLLIGGEDPDCFWQDLFQSTLPNCTMILHCSDSEAALIKYASAGFFALKSSYFEQLYDICNRTGLDFNIVRQILTMDSKIGSEYSMVPNQDGTRGWTNLNMQGFINWANEIQAPLSILETITKYNDEIRKNQ